MDIIWISWGYIGVIQGLWWGYNGVIMGLYGVIKGFMGLYRVHTGIIYRTRRTTGPSF